MGSSSHARLPANFPDQLYRPARSGVPFKLGMCTACLQANDGFRWLLKLGPEVIDYFSILSLTACRARQANGGCKEFTTFYIKSPKVILDKQMRAQFGTFYTLVSTQTEMARFRASLNEVQFLA